MKLLFFVEKKILKYGIPLDDYESGVDGKNF